MSNRKKRTSDRKQGAGEKRRHHEPQDSSFAQSTQQPEVVKKRPPQPPPIPLAEVGEAESQLCPYDENLLERSRTQWQFGDWESLAQLSRDTLQHHPDRAKLALLAAAGHLQQGDAGAAHQSIRLAQEWGCGKRLISQILIAGVHNTLGRASAVGGQGSRALKHFESAITSGAPGSEKKLLTQARIGKQLEQLGLPETGNLLPSIYAAGGLPRLPSLGESMLAIREQVKAQNEELVVQATNQKNELIAVCKFLEDTVKNELLNATKQLEAFLGVQYYLISGNLTGSMHGWPISPDFALYLIQLLESNDYDLVIEFGSGTSSVLMAKALTRAALRRQRQAPVRQVAFEHLEIYHAQTLADLQQAGLIEAVQLVHAPLIPFSGLNGNVYPFYDCHRALAELAQGLTPADLRVLVVVDGPPAATGRHARYPATPAVLAHFSCARIDFLLDDYIRKDEKEVAQLWLADIHRCGLKYTMTEIKMEKDACLINVFS